MSRARTFGTARRVLDGLRHDPPTVAMVIAAPCLLLALFELIYSNHRSAFDQAGPPLLAIFPLVTVFQATSIALLRERVSGTLERLMTTPLTRLELLGGYALAFGIVAVVQALAASALTLGPLGLDAAGSPALIVLLAILVAFLGMGIGLLVSAFVRNEFQVTQMTIIVVLPQVLLCGLIEPRQNMPGVLRAVSDVLPLSYAVDGMHHLARSSQTSAALIGDLVIVLAFAATALLLSAGTLRERTG